MKKQLIIILIITCVFQFLVIYKKNINEPKILQRPAFLVKDSRNNYSEIFPLSPIESIYDYSETDKLTFSKTTVSLIQPGSKLTYVGDKKIKRIIYRVYKFKEELLLIKEDIAANFFRGYIYLRTTNQKDEEQKVDKHKKLIELINRNKEINTDLCLDKHDYDYDLILLYLKDLLKYYNLEREVNLGTEKDVKQKDNLLCINAQFSNLKTYFFVSQFVAIPEL